MLTIFGKRQPFCDRVSRRNFLRIGGLALGGLSMPDIFRAEAQAGISGSKKAIIMVFLSGGPPHQDMVDLKPDAPRDIRGEFNPIATNVPGIEICEHLPLMARMADKLAIIRSIVGSEGHHASFQCMPGWPPARQPQGGWPSFGSAVVSKFMLGPTLPRTPAFVGLSPPMKSAAWADPGQPGVSRHGRIALPLRPSAAGECRYGPQRRHAGAGSKTDRSLLRASTAFAATLTSRGRSKLASIRRPGAAPLAY